MLVVKCFLSASVLPSDSRLGPLDEYMKVKCSPKCLNVLNPGDGNASIYSTIIHIKNMQASGHPRPIHNAEAFLRPLSPRPLLSPLLPQPRRSFIPTMSQNPRPARTNQSNSFYGILLRFYSTHQNDTQQHSVDALTQCLEDMLRVPGRCTNLSHS